MTDMFVFTECVNCAKIADITLKRYFEVHSYPLFVFCTKRDFEELSEEIRHRVNIKFIIVDPHIEEYFKNGHRGTAHVFTEAIKVAREFGHTRLARFDSDVYFKQESIIELKKHFDEGYDIIGTRRCYGNNPGGVKGLENYPDTISTYFMGLNLEQVPDYDADYLARMIQGAVHPLGWPVLDFFDPVTHRMMQSGSKVKFLDWNEYGSQNEHGKKTNNYELNLHMDNGSKLTHFGGVASGYSYFNKQSNPEKSYGEWALGRYALFAKVFYSEDVGYNKPAVYGNDGRWIFGGYDEHILELVKKEIA